MTNIDQSKAKIDTLEVEAHPNPAPQAHTAEENPHLNPEKANRAIGIFILVVMFGILWIYGWGSEIRLISGTTFPANFLSQTIYGNLFVLSAVFTVIGFGLLMVYFKNSTATALLTSIFTVSFTILLSPIFQKFWFNVFLTDFHGATPTSQNPDRFYIFSLEGLYIYTDLFNLKIALANAVAQLVMALGLFGRLNPPQLVVGSFLFNFAWNLNHFLCVHLQQLNPDNRLFDDYQISNVYLFAATFGIVIILIVKKPHLTTRFASSDYSVILSQVGSFFLFLSFCSTTTFYSLKFGNNTSNPNNGEFARSYVWQEAFLGTFFALSASVISTYIFSILLGWNKIGIRQSIMGTIMGAVLYGPVAGTSVNIGAAIAIGLAAGAISAFFFKKLYPRLNQNAVRDSFGIILVLVVSFLATIMITPIVISAYNTNSVNLTTLEASDTDKLGASINADAAGWVLIYVAISVGIGIATGAVTGLILYLLQKLTGHEYDDIQVFSRDRGLNDLPESFHDQHAHSAAELNR